MGMDDDDDIDDADMDRLIDHVKLCHKVISSLVDIIAALWESVDPGVKHSADADRLERLIETIRRATNPSGRGN